MAPRENQSGYEKRCSRCGKPFSSEVYLEHFKKCTWKRCLRCLKHFIPSVHKLEHGTKCQTPTTRTKRCSRCGKYFRSEVHSEHYKNCDRKRCRNCHRYFSSEVYDLEHGKKCKVKRKLQERCRRCRKSNFQEATLQEHIENCEFRPCTGRRKIFGPEDMKSHKETCSFRACSNCYQVGIPEKDFEKHVCKRNRKTRNPKRLGMPKWSNCKRCQRRIPYEVSKDHRRSCPFHHCWRCGKCKMTSSEFKRHDCKLRKCHACRKMRIPEKDWYSYKIACVFKRCRHCGMNRIPQEDWAAHHCGISKCYRCSKKIPLDQYPEHRRSCDAAVFLKRSSLVSSGHCIWIKRVSDAICDNPRKEGFQMCEIHAVVKESHDANTSLEKHHFRQLLSRNTRLPIHGVLLQFLRSTFVFKVADEWYQSPRNIGVCDLEMGIISDDMNHFDI